MKLGARWRTGETPHRGVPPTLYETIEQIELEFPGAHSWTLTWLENRPVLALDVVATVSVQYDGTIRVRRSTSTALRDGLESSPQSGVPSPNNEPDLLDSDDNSDEDNDDWLN